MSWMEEHLDFRLKGKYQLLIAGYAWLINLWEKRSMTMIPSLELELEEMEEEIKMLKRKYRKLTGERWGRREYA